MYYIRKVFFVVLFKMKVIPEQSCLYYKLEWMV